MGGGEQPHTGNKPAVTKGERERGGANERKESRGYKLLHIKYVRNKDILYSTGNYRHYLSIT